MLDRLEAAVRLDYVHTIAHPFSDHEHLIGDLRAIYEALPPARLQDVLGLAADREVALEVNGASLASPTKPHYPVVYAEICRIAKGQGVRFTYGSDSHNCEKLGMTPEVAAWIDETGLLVSDFLTPDDLPAKRG